MKNPIILPHRGRLTQLLIEEAHARVLHGGARLTLTYLRQRYWIVGGNRAVKSLLRRCVRCHRFTQTDQHQLMGNLPYQRVTPCRPFTHTGVDFSGHVNVKLNKGRGAKTSKGYIAIFVCMATKAIHIELVSDLSTETFIAAFQRLCARRGTPKHMYSDCGTNFVGAAKVLRKEFDEFKKILSPQFFNELAKLEVEWHFNAPAWPSAGGLWEAAVKSMKHHLRRILGEQKLTYEEFTTLLAKIEACLNSRPLCPLTEDPEEFYNCLTPGHFLTGTSIMSLPLSDYKDVTNIDVRRRWQLIEHMFQQYWKNWSSDYLTQLQTRSKWNKPVKNLQEGDIVLVKDNNLPPGKWALGRVITTHPGSDGYVRVITLKTQMGTIKRPVVKLSPLPFNSEIESEKEEPKIQDTKPKEKGRKSSTFSHLLTTLLILFTLLPVSYGFIQDVALAAQITTLEHERPIYYDTIGEMQMVRDEWILLMYYNLTTYWEGTRRMEDYFDTVKKLCDEAKLIQCRTAMEQLEHEMELLRHYNSILINPHKHLTNRKKRGLIDGVGYIANSLFGILDQRFAEKYQQDIHALQSNEDYLLELIKNQTTIVELENKVLKKSEDNIHHQFDMIDNYINASNLNMAHLETKMEILSGTAYFNSASLTAYLLINSLRRFQEMLFNSLTNVYQGHIDVHLITPLRLIQTLNEISGQLPKTLSLPVENYKEDIKEIYKLIYVKARITEDYFLFETHLPLVANEDFTLYRAIPIPMNINRLEADYVITTSEFIAVNFKENFYVSMTQDNFKECMPQKAETLICKKGLPLFKLHSNNAPCEARLLSHENMEPCDIQHVPCKDAWIELHKSNNWLAICCSTCTLRTICMNEVTSKTLTSSAIVSLPQGCILQSKDLTIFAHNHYGSRVKMDYDFSVPPLNSSINKIVNLSYHYAPNKIPSTDLDIEEIKRNIMIQRAHEKLPTITGHDIHHYVISYLLLAAAIITLIVAVARKHCSKRVMERKTKSSDDKGTEDIELQEIHRNCDARSADGTCTVNRTGGLHCSLNTGTRNIAFNFD